MNYREFAQKIKTKYPDYGDMDDRDLAQKMVQKFPEYSDVSFDDTPAESPRIGVELPKNLGTETIAPPVSSVQLPKDVSKPAVTTSQGLGISYKPEARVVDLGHRMTMKRTQVTKFDPGQQSQFLPEGKIAPAVNKFEARQIGVAGGTLATGGKQMQDISAIGDPDQIERGRRLAEDLGITPEEIRKNRYGTAIGKGLINKYRDKLRSQEEIEDVTAYGISIAESQKVKTGEKIERAGKELVKTSFEKYPAWLQEAEMQDKVKELESMSPSAGRSLKRGDLGGAIDIMIADAAITGDQDFIQRAKNIKNQFAEEYARQDTEEKKAGVLKYYGSKTLEILPMMVRSMAMEAPAMAIPGLGVGKVAKSATRAVGSAASMGMWMKQGAGDMYSTMTDEGVPHEIALSMAVGGSIPYAYIEKAQIGQFSKPGVRQAVNKSLGRFIARQAAGKTLDWVKESGEEVVQQWITSGEAINAFKASGMDDKAAEAATKQFSDGLKSGIEGGIAFAPLNLLGLARGSLKYRKPKEQTPSTTGERTLGIGVPSESATFEPSAGKTLRDLRIPSPKAFYEIPEDRRTQVFDQLTVEDQRAVMEAYPTELLKTPKVSAEAVSDADAQGILKQAKGIPQVDVSQVTPEEQAKIGDRAAETLDRMDFRRKQAEKAVPREPSPYQAQQPTAEDRATGELVAKKYGLGFKEAVAGDRDQGGVRLVFTDPVTNSEISLFAETADTEAAKLADRLRQENPEAYGKQIAKSAGVEFLGKKAQIAKATGAGKYETEVRASFKTPKGNVFTVPFSTGMDEIRIRAEEMDKQGAPDVSEMQGREEKTEAVLEPRGIRPNRDTDRMLAAYVKTGKAETTPGKAAHQGLIEVFDQVTPEDVADAVGISPAEAREAIGDIRALKKSEVSQKVRQVMAPSLFYGQNPQEVIDGIRQPRSSTGEVMFSRETAQQEAFGGETPVSQIEREADQRKQQQTVADRQDQRKGGEAPLAGLPMFEDQDIEGSQQTLRFQRERPMDLETAKETARSNGLEYVTSTPAPGGPRYTLREPRTGTEFQVRTRGEVSEAIGQIADRVAPRGTTKAGTGIRFSRERTPEQEAQITRLRAQRHAKERAEARPEEWALWEANNKLIDFFRNNGYTIEETSQGVRYVQSTPENVESYWAQFDRDTGTGFTEDEGTQAFGKSRQVPRTEPEVKFSRERLFGELPSEGEAPLTEAEQRANFEWASRDIKDFSKPSRILTKKAQRELREAGYDIPKKIRQDPVIFDFRKPEETKTPQVSSTEGADRDADLGIQTSLRLEEPELEFDSGTDADRDRGESIASQLGNVKFNGVWKGFRSKDGKVHRDPMLTFTIYGKPEDRGNGSSILAPLDATAGQVAKRRVEALKGVVRFQIEAYHGSPHEVDKFRSDRIGTGEGNQAFGYGLYFTNEKDIAETYATNLSRIDPEKVTYDGKSVQEMYDNAMKEMQRNPRSQKANAAAGFWENVAVRLHPKTALDQLREGEHPGYKEFSESLDMKKFKGLDKSNVYSVTIHKGKTPDQYDYLLWDQEITEAQAKKITMGIANLPVAVKRKIYKNTDARGFLEFSNEFKKMDYDGKDAYGALSNWLGSDKKASEFLLKNGIDGINYPAGSLSNVESTARNYVVFDPETITIEKRIRLQAEETNEPTSLRRERPEAVPQAPGRNLQTTEGQTRQGEHPNMRAVVALEGAINRSLGESLPENSFTAVDAPKTEAHQAVDQLVPELFGRPVAWFQQSEESKSEFSFGGAVTSRPEVFINVDTRKPVMVTAVHEGIHIMRQEHPDLYQELVRAAVEQGTSEFESYRQQIMDRGNYEAEISMEETLAEISGERFTDPEFLRGLAERSPEAFRRFVEIMQDVIKRITDWIRRSNIQHAAKYFRELDRFDQALQDALIEMNRRQRQPMRMAAQREVRASKEVQSEVQVLSKTLRDVEDEFEELREARYRGTLSREAFDKEWESVEKRAAAIRRKLYDLTGDPYGRSKESKLRSKKVAEKKEAASKSVLDQISITSEEYDTEIVDFPARGFLLPDGNYLSIGSGTDHRSINGMVDLGSKLEKKYATERTSKMFHIMRASGAIRFIPESNSFQIIKEPTSYQLSAIHRYIKENGSAEVEVGENGRSQRYTDDNLFELEDDLSPSRFSRERTDQTQTPEFKAWFGDSKVVDAEGKPLVVYHGGRTDINSFEQGPVRGENLGAGFFTDDPKISNQYAIFGEPKTASDVEKVINSKEIQKTPFGDDIAGRNTPVFLDIKKPIHGDDLASDVLGDDEYWLGSLPDKWREAYDGGLYTKKEITEMVDNDEIHLEFRETLPTDAGFEGNNLMLRLSRILKANGKWANDIKSRYDGIIFKDKEVGGTTYVPFSPTQIKSATGNRGTFDPENPDIRFSRERADDEGAFYVYRDRYDNAVKKTVSDALSGKKERQQWDILSPERMVKIWQDYSRTGVVRDERGIDDILDDFMDKITTLDANTNLAAHTENDPAKEIERVTGENVTEKQLETIQEYITTEDGTLRISDYGLSKLSKLVIEATTAKTYEEKLLLIDQMLNVVHQRSDLAGWFVDGGRKALDKLSGNVRFSRERRKIEDATGVSQPEIMSKEYRATELRQTAQKLRRKLRKAPQSVVDSRADLELRIRDMDDMSRETVQAAIISYADYIGLSDEPRNQVIRIVRRSRTPADLRKAVESMDAIVERRNTSALFKRATEAVAETFVALKRAQGKTRSTVDAEANRQMQEYVKGLMPETWSVVDEDGRTKESFGSLEEAQEAAKADEDLRVVNDNERAEKIVAYWLGAGKETRTDVDKYASDLGRDVIDWIDGKGSIPQSAQNIVNRIIRRGLEDRSNPDLLRVIRDLHSIRKFGRTAYMAQEAQRKAKETAEAKEAIAEIKQHTPVVSKQRAAAEATTEAQKKRKKRDMGKLKRYGYGLLSAETIMEKMSGWKPNPRLKQMLYYPFYKAASAEARAKRGIVKFFKDTYGNDVWKMRTEPLMDLVYEEKQTGKEEPQRSIQTLTVEQAMGIYSHSKDPGQRRRLLMTIAPDNLEFAEAQVDAVSAALPEKYRKMVESQWDYYYENQYNRINPVYREEHNIDMPRIRYYMPLGGLNSDASTHIAEDVMERHVGKAATQKGMTVSRTATRMPLANFRYFDMVLGNMQKVEHYIAFNKAVRQANRYMANKDLLEAMDAHSPVARQNIEEWINAMARGTAMTPEREDSIDPLINWMRNVYSVYQLGGKLTSMAMQVSALPRGLAFVKPRYAMKALGEIARHPVKSFEMIDELSPIFEERIRNWDMAVTEFAESSENQKIFNEKNLGDQWAKIMDFTMYGIGYLDKKVAGAVWLGKYMETLDKETRAGKSESEAMESAISAADEIVRKTQQGGGLLNSSKLERGSAFSRAITQFMSENRKTLQMAYEYVSKFPKMSNKERASIMALAFIAPSVVVWFIRNGFRPDEPEEILNQSIQNIAAGLPVLGIPVQMAAQKGIDVVTEKITGVPKTRAYYETHPNLAAPYMSMIEVTNRAIQGVPEGDWMSGINAGLQLVPAGKQISRSIDAGKVILQEKAAEKEVGGTASTPAQKAKYFIYAERAVNRDFYYIRSKLKSKNPGEARKAERMYESLSEEEKKRFEIFVAREKIKSSRLRETKAKKLERLYEDTKK